MSGGSCETSRACTVKAGQLHHLLRSAARVASACCWQAPLKAAEREDRGGGEESGSHSRVADIWCRLEEDSSVVVFVACALAEAGPVLNLRRAHMAKSRYADQCRSWAGMEEVAVDGSRAVVLVERWCLIVEAAALLTSQFSEREKVVSVRPGPGPGPVAPLSSLS